MPRVQAESAVFFGIGLFGDHAGGVTDASSINHSSSLSPDDQTKEATCAPDITADRVTMPTEERPTDLTHVNHRHRRRHGDRLQRGDA